jgi:hypothetical protein
MRTAGRTGENSGTSFREPCRQIPEKSQMDRMLRIVLGVSPCRMGSPTGFGSTRLRVHVWPSWALPSCWQIRTRAFAPESMESFASVPPNAVGSETKTVRAVADFAFRAIPSDTRVSEMRLRACAAAPRRSQGSRDATSPGVAGPRGRPWPGGPVRGLGSTAPSPAAPAAPRSSSAAAI